MHNEQKLIKTNIFVDLSHNWDMMLSKTSITIYSSLPSLKPILLENDKFASRHQSQRHLFVLNVASKDYPPAPPLFYVRKIITTQNIKKP